MTTPHEIYLEAARRGLRLEPRENKLAVIPKGKCPPDFAAVLLQHKFELLDLLEAQTLNLKPDCAPWLRVARRVNEGEFDGIMDDSVRGALEIGLRSIPHPICQRALARLQQQHNN